MAGHVRVPTVREANRAHFACPCSQASFGASSAFVMSFVRPPYEQYSKVTVPAVAGFPERSDTSALTNNDEVRTGRLDTSWYAPLTKLQNVREYTPGAPADGRASRLAVTPPGDTGDWLEHAMIEHAQSATAMSLYKGNLRGRP